MSCPRCAFLLLSVAGLALSNFGCEKVDPPPKNTKELRDRHWTYWARSESHGKIGVWFDDRGSGSLNVINGVIVTTAFSYEVDGPRNLRITPANYDGYGNAEITQEGRLHFQMVLTNYKDPFIRNKDFKKQQFDYVLDFEKGHR